MRRTLFTTLCFIVLASTAATPAAAAAAERSYPIINKFNGRCLDADWQRINVNGTKVQLWDCYGPGQANQQWFLRPVHSYFPEYQIVNKASGRCLDAAYQWGGVNGTPIQLWDCYGPGQLNQIWQVYYEGDNTNYVFRNKMYGRVLDAKWESIAANGTPVHLWDNYGSAQRNQRWRWL